MDKRILYLLPCLWINSACVSTVSIDAKDKVSFTELAASVPLDDDHSRIRFRAARANGDFTQTLQAGNLILINDSSISGPAVVDGEIDLRYYSIAIGFETADISSSSLRFGYYFGLAQTSFDLTLREGGSTYQADDDTTELYLQYLISGALSENWDLGFSWAFSIGREISGISELDLRLEYEVAKNLSIAGGYRWFDYEYGLGGDESNLSIDFRGPFIGLHFPF